MVLVIGLLTLVMVLDCLLLVMLVLIQLPKKEAGAGVAFGGAATDALFGAGKGNVLTQITKYSATAFFVLAVILSVLQRNLHSRSRFQQLIGQPGRQAPVTAPASASATAPAKPGVPLTSSTNTLISPQVEDTNAAAAALAAPTNTPAPK